MSPFDGGLLAVAASQNFGLKGSGRLYIIEGEGGRVLRYFDFRDGIFDVAWSEVDRKGLVVGGGDGKVYRVNLGEGTLPQPPLPTPPVAIYGHGKEISSLDWCPLRQDKFLSTSWDKTIQISSSLNNISTIRGHSGVVNEARWSPRHGNLLISVSADRTARLWDDRHGGSVSAVITPDEALLVQDFLTVDWNKYEEWNIVTGTPSDLLFWDIRSLARGPVNRIPLAHRRAIKRVRFSPWQGNKLASVGFDMTLRLWDLASLNPRGLSFDHYTEFVTGLDWSNFERNKLFTCSWDETVRFHKQPSS